jgi:hypothetical protein
VVQAGTAVSSRIREHHPNSVNIIERVDAGACVAQRWDYSAERDEFHCIKTEQMQLERGAN